MNTRIILLQQKFPGSKDSVAVGEIRRAIKWFRNDYTPPMSGSGPYQSRAFPYIELPPFNDRWPVHVENFLNVKTREGERFWTARLRYNDNIPSEAARNTKYLFNDSPDDDLKWKRG